jgi:orotate phosphoribosyltransferase
VPPAARETPATMINARHPDLARFLREKAIIFGSFTLASKQKSDYYCDGKQATLSGEGLSLIIEAILQETRDVEFDAIGGMDMGATPIAPAAAYRLFQLGRDVPSFVVRKEVKSHGTMKAIEGPLPQSPSRVVILEDVVTSGGSLLKAIDVVRAAGHEVVLAISVLDREAGGGEALRARGVRYQPLVRIAELGLSGSG